MKAITNFIFNPFHRIAGGKALLWGLLGIIVAGLLAYYAKSRFDGFIDFHFGFNDNSNAFYIFDGCIAWFIGCVLLYIAGKLSSTTNFRTIDIIGTTALARLPLILQPLLVILLGIEDVQIDQAAIVEAVLQNNYEDLHLPLLEFTVLGISAIAFTIWYIILLYKAFVISTNAKGGKAITAFVVAIIIAEIISIYLLRSY